MKCSLAFLFFLPIFCFSQNVRVNLFDKFIKKHRIELEPITIPITGKGKVSISFSSVASDLYVELSGSGWGASTIDAGNELIFLFANDSTVTVRSTDLQTFEPGITASTYKHQYSITYAGLNALSRFELTGLRKFSFKDFSDVSLPRENALKVRGRSTLFMDELRKAGVLKTTTLLKTVNEPKPASVVKKVKYINLKDINKYVGDSVEFCSKIYTARYFESSENAPTLLDLQSDFTDPVINAVVLQEHRKNFNNMPEKLYINKDVCISGLVTLRNNIPYLIIRDKSQVKVKTPISLSEVDFFVGDSVTVMGKVLTARYFADSKTQPTLLNMGAPFPDQLLTVVIESMDRKNFVDNPEIYYLNKEISVSGKIVLFKNKPQIVVRNSEQVKVLKEDDLMPASVISTDVVLQQTPQQDLRKTAVDKFTITPAEFPGGETALIEFLNKNLRCPEPLQINERRTVLANFNVNIDGSLSDIKISLSPGSLYDVEVVRVLKKMPKWKPMSKNEILVAGVVTQAFTFKREQAKE